MKNTFGRLCRESDGNLRTCKYACNTRRGRGIPFNLGNCNVCFHFQHVLKNGCGAYTCCMCNSNVQLEERQERERGGCVASNLGRARGREAEREAARWPEAERQVAAVGKLCLCLCRQINRLQGSEHSNALHKMELDDDA